MSASGRILSLYTSISSLGTYCVEEDEEGIFHSEERLYKGVVWKVKWT